MPTNMVLRFRDLISETIPEHRKLIESGHVWWGWWSKPEEIIPRVEFDQFRKTIKEKGFIWVYLADSGTLRLYKAKLTEIDFGDEEEPIECSDMDKSPDYYAFSKFKAWFRFENIIDAFPEEISQWSYDQDCHLTITPFKNEYHHKQISSISEMIKHSHQTIYFILPYDPKKHKDKLSKTNSIKDEEELSYRLNKYTNEIMDLIENINKKCQVFLKKGAPPICMPPYPREIESALKRPAIDEITFRDFSSQIYKLIFDGHKMVREGRSVISASDFSGFGKSLLNAISTLRCDFHHLNADKKNKKKKQLGELYHKLTGKSIVGTPKLRITFQAELLKWTAEVLAIENQFIK